MTWTCGLLNVLYQIQYQNNSLTLISRAESKKGLSAYLLMYT